MKPAKPDLLAAWSRLVRAARPASEARPEEAPFGFATRVAALGLAARAEAPALVEAFALRAVALAGFAAVLAVLLNLGEVVAFGNGDDLVAFSDSVSVVLALVD
jgi:hypothetical protein